MLYKAEISRISLSRGGCYYYYIRDYLSRCENFKKYDLSLKTKILFGSFQSTRNMLGDEKEAGVWQPVTVQRHHGSPRLSTPSPAPAFCSLVCHVSVWTVMIQRCSLCSQSSSCTVFIVPRFTSVLTNWPSYVQGMVLTNFFHVENNDLST